MVSFVWLLGQIRAYLCGYILNTILNLSYGLINCYLTWDMNWTIISFYGWKWGALSDICLKSEKLAVINWQPENCKDKFQAPRDPVLFITCNFTLLSLSIWCGKGNWHAQFTQHCKILALLFFKTCFSSQFSQGLKKLISILFLLYNWLKYIDLFCYKKLLGESMDLSQPAGVQIPASLVTRFETLGKLLQAFPCHRLN